MHRVALVDDEQVILGGLARAFPWGEYGCEVAGTAADGREGLALIRKVRPHILFTDIRMPNMDGLSMIAALRSEYPGMLITVLTAFRDFDYAKRALTLGVCRYLLKPSKMEELREAVGYMTKALAESPSEAADTPGGAGSLVARSALKYIEGHYTEHISLGDVAGHVYVSQWHLSKLINGCLGRSFFDILSSLRVEKAKELLKDPALKVHEIALMVGYGDVAHFSKSFKRQTGLSPLQYRNS